MSVGVVLLKKKKGPMTLAEPEFARGSHTRRRAPRWRSARMTLLSWRAKLVSFHTAPIRHCTGSSGVSCEQNPKKTCPTPVTNRSVDVSNLRASSPLQPQAFRALGCRSWVVPHAFFFQAEDGIRDLTVTGVQTCALPI